MRVNAHEVTVTTVMQDAVSPDVVLSPIYKSFKIKHEKLDSLLPLLPVYSKTKSRTPSLMTFHECKMHHARFVMFSSTQNLLACFARISLVNHALHNIPLKTANVNRPTAAFHSSCPSMVKFGHHHPRFSNVVLASVELIPLTPRALTWLPFLNR